MSVEHYQLKLVSENGKVTYTNITDKVNSIIKTKSGISNGIVVVSSPHTTCSVIFEEYVHDKDWNGDEYLQVDLNRILNKIIPRQFTESDYLYPGTKHVKFLKDISKINSDYPNDLTTILNADAHIKASLLGSNEIFTLENGILSIGSVGYIYFVDWDQNRERKRTVIVTIIGD